MKSNAPLCSPRFTGSWWRLTVVWTWHLALCLAVISVLTTASQIAAAQSKTIVIAAPHPDDEALCCAGVIYDALQQGNQVYVVVVTNGDAWAPGTPPTPPPALGYQREAESVAAMGLLGIPEQNVIFFGYGDQGLQGLYQSTTPTTIIPSVAGQTETYANRGLGGVSYHQYVYGVPGQYNRVSILQDMEAMLQSLKPDEIYTTGLWDDHPDHTGTFNFVVEALLDLKKQGVTLSTRVHETFVHAVCQSCAVPTNPNYLWPGWVEGVPGTFVVTQPFPEPYYLDSMTPYKWSQIESIPVPVPMQNTNESTNLKAQIISQYVSQDGGDPNSFIFAFPKWNEWFWIRDFSTNVAGLATVSASSAQNGDNGASAVDGFIAGYPGPDESNYPCCAIPWEWATNGELNGAWIQLTWPTSVTISQVVLYNRQNGADDVMSGTLRFSDGSTVPVGQLPINGNGSLISFAPKTVTSMKFTVDNAVGANIGLTEIEVFGKLAGTTVNHPQLFQGPVTSVPLQLDQYGQSLVASITDAQTTGLSVQAFDVDAQPLTYTWSSGSGDISGTGTSVTFNPPVVAVPTLVTTTVTVSDGKGGTIENSTLVNVTPSNKSGLTVTLLEFNPTSVASGSAATGTVFLSGTAANGAVVTLSNSNPAIANVPSTVTVAPGSSTATFSVSTVFVSTTTSATVSASLGGATQTASLTVLQPPVAMSLLTVNPPTVGGGNGSMGTVTLNGPALTGGAVIALSSSQPSVAATPATVTVPAGLTSATFPITTQPVALPVSVTLSAKYVGQTLTTSLRVGLYVPPNLATIATVSVSSQTPASGQLGTSAVDGIMDGSPTPGDPTREWATNGQLAGAWITLTWSSPVTSSEVVLYDRPNLDDNVTSGTLSFSDGSTVPVGTLPNNGAGLTVSFASRTVTWMTFTVNTVAASSQNIGLAEIAVIGSLPPASLAALTLNPATVTGGTPSTGTATLTNIAPAGGAVVTLSNSNTAVATVPSSVTVPAGATSAAFTITTNPVSTSAQATIQGSYAGTQSAMLTVNPLTVSGVSLNPSTVTGGTSSTGTVTLNGMAPSGGALVTLSSSNPTVGGVPANVTIAAGAASGTFTVTTSTVGAQATATISASYNGTQVSSTLTVNPVVITSFSLSPATVVGGISPTGAVTLSGAAPAGGTVVTLTSNNASVASVPTSVTVPSGSASVTFAVTTNVVAATTSVAISAVCNGTQGATLLVTPAVLGGGGLQPFAADSFNRGNGSLGSNWTTLQVADSAPVIATQQVQSTYNRAQALYYGGINWPADQYAQAQITASNGGSTGPAVRMTSNGYYAGTVGTLGTGNAQVSILLNGTAIKSSSTATVLANDYLQLSVQGTTLTLTDVTQSTTLLTTTDSTISAGYPGLYVSDGGSLANWSAGLTTTPLTLATLASDNFNRANAPNLGPNWAVGPGYYALQIINDQIESAGQGQPPGTGHGKEYYTAVSFPSDQWSQGQVIASNVDINGAIVRYQGSVDTHYVGFVNVLGPAGTCTVTMDRDISGAPVVLATDSRYCSVSSGDYVRLQAQGSLLSYIDVTTGTLLLTAIDTMITGGSPGWSLNPQGGTPIAANWSGGAFTNVSGVMQTPTPGSTLTGSNVTFTWSAGSGATAYWLDIGTSPGGNTIYQSGNLGNVLATTVNTLPINGSTLYATLYSLINGSWVSNAYAYTAFNVSSLGGAMQTPVPGSTLTGSSATFTWSAGSIATAYWVDIGTSPGGNTIYQSGSLGNVLTTTVNTLPINGSTVYVTLYSLVNGSWLSKAYTYTASSPSVMQTPSPGSTLTGSSVTFTWSAASGATGYWVDIGTSPGGNTIYQSGNLGNVLTTTVNTLPTDGSTVFVRLYSLVGGQWFSNTYTYTAFNRATGLGVIQTPTPGSTLTGSGVTFTWSAGSGATGYWMDIGTSPGGNTIYQSGNLGNVLTTTVNTLPTNGSSVYVTLYSYVGSQWLSNSYTYTAFNRATGLGAMQTPTPGSTVTGNAATFTWSAGSVATSYWLDIGTSLGGNTIYQSGNLGSALTATVSSLPANNSTIYVTLYSMVGGQWMSNVYTYTSAPSGTEI